MLSVLAAAAAAQSRPLAILPYLTELGGDHATITWQRLAAGTSSFRYGVSPYYELGTVRLQPGVAQQVTLRGLTPATTYYYEVDAVHRGRFHTLSSAAVAGNPLRFVAIGHTHGTENYDHYPDELLVAAVAAAEPDFVVHTGDATWLARQADYDRYFFDPFRQLLPTTPVYVAPGNHDAGWPFHQDLDLRAFKSLLAYGYDSTIASDKREAFYERRIGSVQLLFLSYTSDLRPGSPQLLWLGQRLNSTPQLTRIVLFGGAQSGYYDEQALLDFLAASPVDFIVRGDGAQPAQMVQVYRGKPMYYLGTGSEQAHRLLLFELRGGCLTVTVRSPVGEDRVIDRRGCAGAPPAATKGAPAPADLFPAFDSRVAGFSIEPYLVDLTDTSAILAWSTDRSRTSVCRWGETVAADAQGQRTPPGLHHHLRITGLTPHTVYHFDVDGHGGSFRTRRSTDTGTGSKTAVIGHDLFDSEPDAPLAGLLARLQPDALVWADRGRWTGGTAEYRQRFFAPFAELLRAYPIHVAAGNQLDATVFRTLFPRDLPPAADDLYYARTDDGVLFLHLSHHADTGAGSRQRAFVSAALAASDAAFRVAVVGGRPPVQTDDFLLFLANAGVDAIVRCDVAQPSNPRQLVGGVPTFIASSGLPTPHRVLTIRRQDQVLLVHQVAPDGSSLLLDWLYSVRPRQRLMVLDPARAQWDFTPGALRAIFRFTPPLDMRTAAGIQIRFQVPSSRPYVTLEAYILPTDRGDRSGIRSRDLGYGFRTQPIRIDGGDGLVTVPLLRNLPHDGSPFTVDELTLRFVPEVGLQPAMLQELTVFRD